MKIEEVIKNPWIISIVSAIVAALVIPLFIFIFKKLRSMFGIFSGQYIAMTGDFNCGPILIEDVRCHHFKNLLYGKIFGVAILKQNPENGDFMFFAENKAKYKLSGFVDERVFVISYNSKISGVQSSGAIALKGDTSGKIFGGIWSGIVTESIESAYCIWSRLRPKISSKRKKEDFISNAENLIKSYILLYNQGSMSDVLNFSGEISKGKSRISYFPYTKQIP